MATQINFKLKTPHKAEFERVCNTKDIEMTRCLRALALAVSKKAIPARILKQALAMETRQYPENRGRKPKSSKSKRKVA